MNLTTIHLFAGTFGSREAAEQYCQRDWGQAPDKSASVQEWEAWESEFPKWALEDELGVSLDEDFIELHFGPEPDAAWLSPVLEMLEAPDREQIQRAIESDNTLLLLDINALGGFETELRSTARLRYLGAFRARW